MQLSLIEDNYLWHYAYQRKMPPLGTTTLASKASTPALYVEQKGISPIVPSITATTITTIAMPFPVLTLYLPLTSI